MSTSVLGPAELFAVSQGKKCEGAYKCHWCTAPAGKLWLCDEPAPVEFTKRKDGAKNPAGLYVCEGCKLYRRKSCTVWALTEGFKDRQSLRKLSWWMTEEGVRGIGKEDYEKLWNLLLVPPPLFCMSLLTYEKTENQLHLAVVNDHQEVKAQTELWYTIDNTPHNYNVYELKECCKHGPEGKMPGVQALVRILGRFYLPVEKPQEKKLGRPFKLEDDNDIKRVVSKK